VLRCGYHGWAAGAIFFGGAAAQAAPLAWLVLLFFILS
jgi:hypothetical protein